MTPLQTTYLYETETGEQEWELLFTVTPGDPGRLSGPPEKCYPAEPPELEIQQILYNNQPVPDSLSDPILDTLEAACWEELDRLAAEAAEPDDYWEYQP